MEHTTEASIKIAEQTELITVFRDKLSKTQAWAGLNEESKAELIKVLMSVHDGAIDTAHDEVYSTIDETKKSILKLKFN